MSRPNDDDLLVIPAPDDDAPAAASAPHTRAKPIDGSAPSAPSRRGAISDEDLNFWRGELNDVLSRPGETLASRSAAGARPWATRLFGCLCPADLCLLTFCCPCIVFGKTHHRVNKRRDMQGYEHVNTSCLLFLGTGLVGFQWILEALQRAEVRDRYQLEGSCVGDLARSCCCSCCLMAQLEKESEHRERMAVVMDQQEEQYRANERMEYPRAGGGGP